MPWDGVAGGVGCEVADEVAGDVATDVAAPHCAQNFESGAKGTPQRRQSMNTSRG